MQMQNSEIVRSFNEAKNKGKQVKILAELNFCSKEKIMDILKEAGIDVNNRIFNGGNLKTTVSNIKPEAPKQENKSVEVFKKPVEALEVEPVKEDPEPVKKDVPQAVLDALFAESDRLRETINQLQSRLDDITAYLEEIA